MSVVEKKEFEHVDKLLHTIVQLNPRIKYLYIFGGMILSNKHSNLPKALAILEKGIKQYPDDFKMRIYAALSHLSLDSNYLEAAKLLKPIIRNPKTPSYIKNFIPSLLSKGGDKNGALLFLVQNYFESESPLNKGVLFKKIIHLSSSPLNPMKIEKVKSTLLSMEKDPKSTFIYFEKLKKLLII